MGRLKIPESAKTDASLLIREAFFRLRFFPSLFRQHSVIRIHKQKNIRFFKC